MYGIVFAGMAAYSRSDETRPCPSGWNELPLLWLTDTDSNLTPLFALLVVVIVFELMLLLCSDSVSTDEMSLSSYDALKVNGGRIASVGEFVNTACYSYISD